MRITTHKRSPRPARLLAIFLLGGLACLAAGFFALNAAPHWSAKALRLERRGTLATFLPPESKPLELEGEPLNHVELVLPPEIAQPMVLSPRSVSGDGARVHPLMGDASTPGKSRYLITVDEARANDLLFRLADGLGERKRYRDVKLDLRPGGLILHADIHLGIRWQRMGLLLLQEEDTITLSTQGIVVNETVYAMPTSGSLAWVLLPMGRSAEWALDGLRIMGPLPGEAQVDAVAWHDDHLQILAEGTYDVPRSPDTGWQPLEPGLELREIDVTASSGIAVERLTVVRLDPGAFRIRIDYDPTDPKTTSEWAAERDALLVVNGGYFAPETERGQETVGLLISDGQRWGKPLEDYAGMLAVTSGDETSVRWLRDRPYDPAESLSHALQSFPVLVKPGGVMGFPAEAGDGTAARRTVVAQDGEGRLLFMVASRGRLALHELAGFLAKSELGIDVALNLDGGGSTGLWLAHDDRKVVIDSFTAVPSVIAVERR